MATINIAVAGGSGDLGSRLVRALLADGSYRVSVLARANPDNKVLDNLRKQGASIVIVDYHLHDELVQALQEIDILVCTLYYGAIQELQPLLIRAAAAAGVRRFVPCDFVDESIELQSIAHEDPDAVRRDIVKAQLEYTRYYCGTFYRYLPTLSLGIDLKNRTATIVGKGDKPISLVHDEDLARFIAASLKDPRSKNTRLGFQSSTMTYLELIAAVEKYSGIKLNVKHLPVNPLFSFTNEIEADDISVVGTQSGYAVELGITGPSKIDNDMCPSVRPTPLDTFLASYFEIQRAA